MFNIAIKITTNNIFILISNSDYKLISILTSGQLIPKLKGRKKVSSVAAKLLAQVAIKLLKTKKCSLATIFVLGNIRRRKTIITVFWRASIGIKEIIDLTPLSHNGCRLRKIRRK